ncbi:BLUF domain-containing protein [Algicola sagamiensis]|uniref:BLUF domain-containing protein n=1 Tax=Algicola sagamiensis TaxID=163869 RepID=UPI00036F7F42|nr:BLUF domain-containing protein [Algicola sagamiensis]
MSQKSPPMVELIYYSHSISVLNAEDVALILEGAREKNSGMDITGLLIYKGGCFLQVIEGPRDKINQLFQSISHDARHFDITLVCYRETDRRNFEAWRMGYLDEQALAAQDLQVGNLDALTASEARNILLDAASLEEVT